MHVNMEPVRWDRTVRFGTVLLLIPYYTVKATIPRTPYRIYGVILEIRRSATALSTMPCLSSMSTQTPYPFLAIQSLILGPGDHITATSAANGTFKFLLIAGQPIGEPIVQVLVFKHWHTLCVFALSVLGSGQLQTVAKGEWLQGSSVHHPVLAMCIDASSNLAASILFPS